MTFIYLSEEQLLPTYMCKKKHTQAWRGSVVENRFSAFRLQSERSNIYKPVVAGSYDKENH